MDTVTINRAPVLHTEEGLRAAGKDQKPVTPESVEKYLKSTFSRAVLRSPYGPACAVQERSRRSCREALPAVRAAMAKLAKARSPERLAEEAFRLYEQFRPGVPAGESGWGAKGTLSLEKIQALAEKPKK